MSAASHWARRRIRRAYELLGDSELALPLTLALTPESTRSRWVSAGTDLVVEGFPRSGNTFAALSIELAQPAPFTLRSHAHTPAQVKRAVRLEVPTLLVVRDPAQAVCSMGVADEHHRIRDLLQYWTHFHQVVSEHRDAIVVVPFDRVTGNTAEMVEELNRRFSLSLAPPAPEAEVFSAIEAKQRRVHGDDAFVRGVPRPDAGRGEALATRRAELEAQVPAQERARAQAVFERLLTD